MRLACGRCRNSRPVSRKLLANVSAGSVDRRGEPVQQRAVGVQHLGDGSLEQLLLALEVVVERTDADVGGLSDREHGHMARPPAARNVRAARTSAARTAHLSRSKRVAAGPFGWVIRPMLAETINYDYFVSDS